MDNIFLITSAVLLFLVVVGFFVGFARNWYRSLIRLGVIAIDFVASLLLAPLLCGFFISKFFNGTTLTIFNFSFDFSEIAENLLENNVGENAVVVQSEVQALAETLINIAVNIVLFYAMFLSVLILSLIIYWVVLIIVKSVKKSDKESNQEKSHVGTRFIGGLEGIVGAVLITFTILLPVFGVMSICDKFLVEETPNQETTSAISTQNVMLGQLYYTDNEQIGKFESYIEKYADIKARYNKSIVGKFFNTTKLGNAGSSVFDYLTRAEYKDQKIKFTEEAAIFVETYNLYKETFVDKKFELTNNNSLDSLSNISSKLTKSVIVRDVVETILPKAIENWSNGEKFLGIEVPTSEEFDDVIKDLLETAKNINSTSRLNYNAQILIDALKNLNDKNVIESLENNTGIDQILKDNETIVKDTLLIVIQSDDIKNSLPILLDELINVLYNKVVNDGGYEKLSKDFEFEILDWNNEAENIQKLANEILDVYELLKDSSTEEEVLENLDGIGEVLDTSKESVILANSIKNFIVGYIGSENFANGVISAETKQSIISYINEKWALEGDQTFEFEKVFGVIQDINYFALKYSQGEDVKLQDLKEVFVRVIESNDLKNDVNDFIKTNLLDEFVQNDEFKIVALDLLELILDESNIETLDADLAAGQAIIDLTNNINDIDQAQAEEQLQTIAQSQIIMTYIDENSDLEGTSHLQHLVNENMNETDKLAFVAVIHNSTQLSTEEKLVFEKLFLCINTELLNPEN